MAKSDRDQPGRPRSSKRCPSSRNGGCLRCRTGMYKKGLRRSARESGRRLARARYEETRNE